MSSRCILWRPTFVWRTVSSLAKTSRSSGSFITCRTYHVTDASIVTRSKEGRFASCLCILTAHETMLMTACLKSNGAKRNEKYTSADLESKSWLCVKLKAQHVLLC